MADISWKEIETLFEEALTRPPSEREAFLEAQPVSEDLRQEVRSLLTAFEKRGEFFEDLAAAEPAEAPVPGAPSDPLELEGSRAGRYMIEAYLGGGGMGIVYKARDTELGRPVALKFLPPHLTRHEEATQRFVREARAAAGLDHPNIATVYEIGQTDDARRFIAMAYYDGETLKEKLARKERLPIEKALDYAVQIAEGLAAAHAAGIVHRDIKPANVIVTEAGRVKIVDFGLAQVTAGSQLTDPGQTLGTAAYMSPEQARGEETGPATDLWSLGIVLYEMLTGERPFQGARKMAILHAILHEELPPIGERRSEVPEVFIEIIEKCLQKAPEERYSSAGVLLEGLNGLSKSGSSVTVAGGSAVGDHSYWKGGPALARRWRGRVVLFTGVIVIAGLLAYLQPFSFLESSSNAGTGSITESSAIASSGGEGQEPRLGERSIAVLPFTYQADEDSSDYFSQGMTDELLIRLSQIEALSVISRTSVLQYLDSDKTLREIGRELGVAYILEGNVQQVGGQVRLQAQLIDARTDRHVWAKGFTRPFENVLELQVDLAREIAGQLQASFLPETERQMASSPEVEPAAYRLYLQGRQLRFRETSESLTEAVDLLQRSVAIDSTFAPAWAVLSTAAWYAERWVGGPLPDSIDGYSLARAAARRALALDSTSAEAHVAMGGVRLVLDKDIPAAAAYFQRAVQLNPGLANAHREYGLHLTRMRQFETAEGFLRKAARLDPASVVAVRDVGQNYLYWGRYERAKRHLKRALALQPDHSPARFMLRQAYIAQDSAEVILPEIRRAVTTDSHPANFLALGWAYIQIGRPDSARAVLGRIEGKYPAVEAVIYGALGKPRRAAERIEQAEFLETHPWHLKMHPAFEPLRKLPPVQERFTEVGLDEASIGQTIETLAPDPPEIPDDRQEDPSERFRY